MGHAMATTTASRTRTGGPSDEEREELAAQVLGWTLTVLIAMIVTGFGLL